MIFVCAGSRGYPFDRLFREIDHLIEKQIITDRVFGQIGQTSYLPKNFEYTQYLDMNKFKEYQNEATLIISHAGTGALISALKLEKQVIAVPRLKEFGEHIDDHQLQVSRALEESGYLRVVRDIKDLENIIRLSYDAPIQKKYARPSNVLKLIDEFILSQ